MIIEQIWTGNDYRNFHYLIACRETGEALVIDPFDYEKCLECAEKHGWQITQILNTHEHHDHIGGNGAMVEATGAKLLAHEKAAVTIEGIDRGLRAGDIVRVGKTAELVALDTPGHTLSHICLLSKTDLPALFSGDTIFAAGAGNCRGGGDAEQLYLTFTHQLAPLPAETKVYPGHDYLANNLAFAVDREPDNRIASALLREVATSPEDDRPRVTTLALEREINPFCRLTSPTIIDNLRKSFPDSPENPSPQEVFIQLRTLRDRW